MKTPPSLPSSIRVREILTPKDPAFPVLIALYREAFPKDEREPTDRLREWLKPTNQSAPNQAIMRHMLCLEREGAPVGFSFIEFFNEASMGYPVYLATHPAERGAGLGRFLFQCSIDRLRLDARYVQRPFYGCVLEVEREEDAVDADDLALRTRRVRWYESLGARLITPTYVQPALTEDQNPIPLNLMWIQDEPGLSEEAIIEQFYSQEFGLPPNHPYVQNALLGIHRAKH
ncbi:MAG: GNAT family N-acetyltransferase [Fimbriimonadia bacterium]|nr:GNAT family N-acetyltransferase [Fimbriimonadia bacterium]